MKPEAILRKQALICGLHYRIEEKRNRDGCLCLTLRELYNVALLVEQKRNMGIFQQITRSKSVRKDVLKMVTPPTKQELDLILHHIYVRWWQSLAIRLAPKPFKRIGFTVICSQDILLLQEKPTWESSSARHFHKIVADLCREYVKATFQHHLMCMHWGNTHKKREALPKMHTAQFNSQMNWRQCPQGAADMAI